MDINIYPYVNVYPRVFRSHEKQSITIEPKYSFITFKENAEYNVLIRPRYKYASPYFSPIKIEASNNKILIEYDFNEEQEYILDIKSAEQAPNCQNISTSVYALDGDLYGKLVLKGDLHVHSTFSDGQESPLYLAVMGRLRGFDFLAITDHNNYEGSAHLCKLMKQVPNNMIIIHGEEISAKGCRAHILSLGGQHAVHPIVSRSFTPEQTTIIAKIEEEYETCLNPSVDKHEFAVAMYVFDKIRDAGGLSVLCHMYWDSFDSNEGKQRGISEEFVRDLVRFADFDAFEIVSGCPEYDMVANTLQRIFYEENLQEKGIPVIGITDTHSSNRDPIYGKNYTIVFSDRKDEESIMDSIRKKRSVAVDGTKNKIICNGQLRYVKYAYFLVKHYFPFHDRLVAMEALVMDRIIQCDTNKRANAIEQLKRNCADTACELSKEWGTII